MRKIKPASQGCLTLDPQTTGIKMIKWPIPRYEGGFATYIFKLDELGVRVINIETDRQIMAEGSWVFPRGLDGLSQLFRIMKDGELQWAHQANYNGQEETQGFRVSAADLAEQGLAFNTTDINVFSVALTRDAQYTMAFLNGKRLQLTEVLKAGGYGGEYCLSDMKGTHIARYLHFQFTLADHREIWNNGYGTDISQLASYRHCGFHEDFDRMDDRGYFIDKAPHIHNSSYMDKPFRGFGRAYPPYGLYSMTQLVGINGMTTARQFSEIAPKLRFSQRVGREITETHVFPADFPSSNQIRDYARPDGTSFLRLVGPEFGKGTFMMPDGTTDFPKLWTRVNLSGLGIGGATQPETLVTTIANSYASSIRFNHQAVEGYNELHILAQHSDMAEMLAYTASLKKFSIKPAPGKELLYIEHLYLQRDHYENGIHGAKSNMIEQDFQTMADWSRTKVRVFYLQENKVFGNLTWPIGIEAFGLNHNNFSGTLPPLPSTLSGVYVRYNKFSGKIPENPRNLHLDIGQNEFTEFPDEVRGMFHADGNMLAGTARLTQCSDFRLSHWGAGHVTQTGPGTIIVDASANIKHITHVLLYNAKVTKVIFPTQAGVTINHLLLAQSPLAIEYVWPAHAVMPPGSAFESYALSGYTGSYPLGTAICSHNINLSYNAMGEASMNATIDSWLDNQANFGNAATPKMLNMRENAGKVSADRMPRVISAVRDFSWNLWLSEEPSFFGRYQSVIAISDGTYNGSPPRIVIQLAAGLNPYTERGQTAEILGTDGVYDGLWIVEGFADNAQRAMEGYLWHGHAFVCLRREGYGFVDNRKAVYHT